MSNEWRNLRSTALQQLAELSVAEASPVLNDEKSTLERLLYRCSSYFVLAGSEPPLGTSQIPMSFRELEVLLALSKAAPNARCLETAQRIVRQLSPYTIGVFQQQLAESHSFIHIQPSPWECLTFSLVHALLSIGLRHDELRPTVLEIVDNYIRHILEVCERNADDPVVHAPLVVSFVGFLEAAAHFARFWKPAERFELVTKIKDTLSGRFLLDVDDIFASLSVSRGKRTVQWNKFVRNYEHAGRPLGSMLIYHGLMKLLVAHTSLLVATHPAFRNGGLIVLDTLISFTTFTKMTTEQDTNTVEFQIQIAEMGVTIAEERLSSSKHNPGGQQQLLFSLKAYALTIYCICVILSPAVNASILHERLHLTITDPVQMSDQALATAALKSLAILSGRSNCLSDHIGLLYRFIVEGMPPKNIARVAAKCLSYSLQNLPEDAALTTLNTLGYVLSSANPERALKGETLQPFEQQPSGSSVSLLSESDEYKQNVYANVVDTIVIVASNCSDPQIISLGLSILLRRLEKVGGALSAKIFVGVAYLLVSAVAPDLESALDMFNKAATKAVWHGDSFTVLAVLAARMHLAKSLAKNHRLYESFLTHTLDSVSSVGSVSQDDERKEVSELLIAQEIEQFFRPIAILLSHDTNSNFMLRERCAFLLQGFWLNCAVHGIVYGSESAANHSTELKTIANYTPSLVSGSKEDESFDQELDEFSILFRRMSQDNLAEHKKRLVNLIPSNELEVRALPYARVIFLQATDFLECMRSEVGGCSNTLEYFIEPALKTGPASECMVSIAGKVADIYISKILLGTYPAFSSLRVSEQLANVFVSCCHRLSKVQMVAFSMADRIIAAVPSALCSRPSMYALLELLTLLWRSCLERETDEYSTQPIFTSILGNVGIEMPDSFEFRAMTLKNFHSKARTWVTKVLNLTHLDMKGLLQTYLSEFEDEASVGRVSLGRTFALEMGGAIPNSDHRLGMGGPMALDRTDVLPTASIDFLGDCNANMASDFVKQYTVRQAYRHGETAVYSDERKRWRCSVLSQIDNMDWDYDSLPKEFIRDTLQNAASLICRSQQEEGALIRHLVRIPFCAFTNESVKLGMVLWIGVMNERPSLQSRMLSEILRNFEWTVEVKMGLFTESFSLSNPFMGKMEYAPSEKEDHITEQKAAGDILYPHLRLLQFLSSHYHATRHGNPQIQKMFLRFIRISLIGLRHATGHPLSREVRFQLVLLGLQILRYTTSLTERQQIKLKELILSGGLSWFRFPPQWSFGGNRLQVKAEAHLLQDVIVLLNAVNPVGSNNKALQAKGDLLLLLVENESTRLATWLYPLDHSRKHHRLPSHSFKSPSDSMLSALLPLAWVEDPAMVLQLAFRFQSSKIAFDVRQFLLNYPEKVIKQPDAAQVLLNDRLSPELTFQLRYLLFWTPVDPITAATFFLPGYRNNSFLIQYAMRSLESHSVDVTFFYVPQIVQTLRYDTLGYVMRFIIETAKFSQLFAHQIIWNIKANAFKDEDAQIPDSVKPTLDIVETKLIRSFSASDKSFYDREFAFFNEVTSISGKLRPYIRKSKPEKNEKIAEELRKIVVDVGVYLPSNPDSVVIDIDRTSGKSLQSHAKAPFMATFKIRRKTIGGLSETTPLDRRSRRQESTLTVTQEKMQAAIFKVGDDCRQDMLALQLISCFRSIFNSVGLDVYLFPYRVTATAPGCGVIDVLPKSISRDMLGRDYEMGLYDYFINKYGGEDSIAFQNARNCFVKSMAAYSVISYLLKFKDRHNGNIMLDNSGHILHIDFGFCFDIAPGGITFERAPFKLTGEMVSVMGGSTDSQSYLWFEELCIKSFLVCRLYVDKLTYCVILMLDSGLPCFKPETIQNFRDRFVLEKTDREAADYMRYLIKKSYSSYSTGQYDRFQHLTNGIPY